MKINKINNENIIVFKHKTTTNSQNAKLINVIENQHDKTPNNPKYYQAINNISFQSNIHYLAVPIANKNNVAGIKVRIPLEENNSATFNLTEEAFLFLDKNGKLDNNKLAIFVELFEDFFKLRKAQHDKEKAVIQRVLNKKEGNVTSINPENDILSALCSSNSKDDEEFLEEFLMNIKDEKERKRLASRYLEKIEEQTAMAAVLAAKEAICILKLSQTANGFDLTKMSEKIDIAIHLEHINAQYSQDFTNTFIEAISNNGQIDINLGQKVIGFMKIEQYLTKESIKNYAETLKQMTKKVNPFQAD